MASYIIASLLTGSDL